MYYRLLVLLTLIICCGVVVTAHGEDQAKLEKVFKAVIDKDGVQRVDLLGGSYFFNPNHIIVRVNNPVELKVRKEPGIVPHNLVLKAPGAGINVDVALDSEPKVIRFTPTRTGSYPFYCDKKLLFFESHREKGMEGLLEVIP